MESGASDAVGASVPAQSVADDAWVSCVELIYPRLHRFARFLLQPEDAQDAVGSALEHVWGSRHKYRASSGAPMDAWAIRVAQNKIRDVARRRRREGRVVQLVDLADAVVTDATEGLATAWQLRQAIENLPHRDAEIIALRFGAGVSPSEVGEILGITPNAVGVALHRALLRLRTLLAEGGQQP